MIYLASPYSHPDPFVREARYLAAMQVLTYMLQRKEWAYSPIVHCHELAKITALPKDAGFWQAYNFYVLHNCLELRILKIEGWEQSRGVAEEIAEAERIRLPITEAFLE